MDPSIPPREVPILLSALCYIIMITVWTSVDNCLTFVYTEANVILAQIVMCGMSVTMQLSQKI